MGGLRKVKIHYMVQAESQFKLWICEIYDLEMADVAIQVSEEEPSVGDSSLLRCLAKITEKGRGTYQRAKSATQFRVIENKRGSDETRFKEATAVRDRSQKSL